MNDDRYKELSDTERDAMRLMATGPVPRDGLEDDTVRVLSHHGLIRSRKRGVLMKVSMAVGAMLAVALVFVAGVTVGKRGGDEAATLAQQGEKQYMLLLYMTSSGKEASAAADEPKSEAMLAIIDEYRQWGARLSEQGLSGECGETERQRVRSGRRQGSPGGHSSGGNACGGRVFPDQGRVTGVCSGDRLDAPALEVWWRD